MEADPTTQAAESEAVSLGATEEKLAVAIAGSFSAAEVYFVGPDAWISPVIFVRLYGRVGGGRLLLAEVALASTTYTQEGGTTTALAIAVRGAHVDGFEVILAQDHGVAVSAGRVVLIASTRADGTDLRPGLPPNLQPRVGQGAAGPPSSRWPVFLSDGAAERGSVASALHIQKSDRRAAYYASAVVGSGTGTTTNKSLLYVWNARTSTRAEIRRVTIAYLAGAGTSALTVRGAHMTAQAGTVGGTSITPLPFDPSDGASAMTSVVGANAPTQVALDVLLFAVPITATGTFVWTWTDLGKPIVLPAGVDGGFEIRVDVSAAATTEMKLHVSIEWLEL